MWQLRIQINSQFSILCFACDGKMKLVLKLKSESRNLYLCIAQPEIPTHLSSATGRWPDHLDPSTFILRKTAKQQPPRSMPVGSPTACPRRGNLHLKNMPLARAV